MNTKFCSGCSTVKTVSEFYKNAKNTDGLYHQCKECHKATRRRSYIKNRKKESERQKEYNARMMANPTTRAINAAKNRIYRALYRRGIRGVKVASEFRKLVGCTPDEYVQYIRENKHNLTWCSYAKTWFVRHTLPVSSFDLKDEQHRQAAFNVTNLQPVQLER